MNKQEKEKLISFIEKEKENITLNHGKYNQTHFGFIQGTKLIEFIEQLDEPQKVKVPEEFDEWYQQIKQQRGFSEMIARYFALWKICQFGFGHDFEDVSHERTPLDLSVWVSDHKDEAVHAILNGYEVEEEPKYYVNIGDLYLKEPLGDTSDFTISMTWNREYAYSFDSWNMAREHASKLGGTVEQVEV